MDHVTKERGFELLGLRDVDIDFAGRSQDAAVRQAIAELKNGDELVIESQSGQSSLAIKNMKGQMVGRTANAYMLPGGKIVKARVSSICVRRLQDVKTEWQSSMVLPEWEVVLPELVVVN